MTSNRRSFLRSLLALPAAPLLPKVTSAQNVLPLTHAADYRLYIDGREVVNGVAQQLRKALTDQDFAKSVLVHKRNR